MNYPHDHKLTKILLFGTTGQLARSFLDLLPPTQVRAVSRSEADFSDPKSCIKILNEYAPTSVINANAYTKVDLAEKEPESAFQVNAYTPGEIHRWCTSQDVPLIHFSTDYVFSGEGTLPWKESDPIQPLNRYGESKAEGEKIIQSLGGKFLIFRTSWVYAQEGQNFLRSMLRLGKERETLQIVSDQVGAPTYAPDLARGALECLQKAAWLEKYPSGIYHLCNSGETSWFHFAEEIFRLAKIRGHHFKLKEMKKISSVEYPTPARRPLNSRLDTTKAQEVFDVRLPDWKKSLETCIEGIA